MPIKCVKTARYQQRRLSSRIDIDNRPFCRAPILGVGQFVAHGGPAAANADRMASSAVGLAKLCNDLSDYPAGWLPA